MASSFLSRRFTLAVFLVALVGVGIGAYYLFFRTPKEKELPRPGSPEYQEYVEAFHVGVAAVDAAQYPLALEKLTEAVKLIPEEPAGWANRGLVHLRENRLTESAADLEGAHELAPDDPEIASLMGLLAEKRGRYAEAADHYRKALEHAPRDLLAQYALASMVDKEGGADSDAQFQSHLEEILKVQPYNLFVLTEMVNVAARRKDRNALRLALERLRKVSPAWSKEARDLLANLEKSAEGNLPGDIPTNRVGLANQLKGEPGWEAGKSAVEGRSTDKGDLVGTSVQRFLRLQPVRATPAPPDTALTFTLEPLPDAPGGRWDVVRAVWLGGENAGGSQRAWSAQENKWVTASAGPAVLVANGQEVRIGIGRTALTFPGGGTPPTAASIVALDWDNDFRTDLFLAGAGGLRFYQQTSTGGFTDVTEKTGLPKDVIQADYFGGWAVDIEMDGDLDIILAPRQGEPLVLRNNRDGTFKVLKPFPAVAGARDFVWADLDNDGAADAAFLDSRGKVHVFANERMGQFRRREAPEGLGKSLALAVADVTDDGMLDLLVLEADGKVMRVSDKDRGKSWEVATVVEGAPLSAVQPGLATLLTADLDNNGGLDLVASTSKETRVWLGDTDGKFRPGPGVPPRVAAAVDLTDDGRIDLLALSEKDQPVRLTNRGTKEYHWQVIRPTASRKQLEEKKTVINRFNSFAIGSEVEVRTGLVIQKQVTTSPVVHLGLGERKKPDVIRIVWPHGVFQAEFNQPGDATILAEQRLGASCPFLFTFDGQRMRFVTDFMWGAPLGVVIEGQDTTTSLQPASWVKVRGDQLAPRDGVYDIRVLANLWETHYYDHLSLMVVDHPANTEIHIDERAADTPLVPEVIVTGPSQPFTRARDQDGRDVTDILRTTDGCYLDGFKLGNYRGVAQDHWVEVELGDGVPSEGPVWLIARGWVYPPNSTVYAAIAQGKHDRPQGLSLELPDGKGGWKVGRAELGCPAGKNKSILIRLDGIEGKGVARHFRLRTNMEIYWDSLAWARGLETKLARQQRLLPDTAEIRYHGTVEMTQANDSSPELPDYYKPVRVEQDWRDLIGYYTRYGDVRELLAKIDDRYVIMNAGDEIALRFAAPADPPPGQKRDFVWISEGWAKDGDFNTRFSRTVLPLPSHDLKSYDRTPGRLQADPVYKRFPRDWEIYHTRYVTPAAFERGLRPYRRPAP